MSAMTDVTSDSFDREVLESEIPVLVDFWGDHCPACRQISPILEELARERAGRLKVVKIHAAENAAISARYGVRSMPTVFVFDRGAVRGQLMGARPKSAFIELIDQAGQGLVVPS
jgi:thioredoxin 1